MNGSSPIKIANSNGYTLLELLLSLGIGAFILGSIYLLLINNRDSYVLQKRTINNQETGWAITQLLRNQLRNAGGLGCAAWHAQFPLYVQTSLLLEHLPRDSKDIIRFYTAQGSSWQPTLPAYLHARVRENTDVIIIHQAHKNATYLWTSMIDEKMPLMVANAEELQENDIVLIADCLQGDIFKISKIVKQGMHHLIYHQPPQNHSSALSKQYLREAQLSVLEATAYYIGKTSRRYENNEAVYALYAYNGQHIEIAEGVTDLKISIDSNTKGHMNAVMITVTIGTDNEKDIQEWPLWVTLRNN